MLLRDDARRPSHRRCRARCCRPLHRGGIQRPRLHARAGDGTARRRGDARRPRAHDRHRRPFAGAIPERTPAIQGRSSLNVRVTSLLEGARLATGHAVIVDVFRAFTTAAFCIAAGAREIVLVADHEQALAMKRRDPRLFLTGEIGGRPIPGFDVGNSPSAIEKLDLTGRRVVQRTSSGTQGVVAATGAAEVLLGSLVIASATARYLANADVVTVVAMGSSAQERSEEDELGAAFIAARLRGEIAKASLDLRDDTVWEEWFPRRDAELALEVDRFAFALPVYRESGLLIARPEYV
ncbi:MAG: 2-phosphosulfolactate phosphatase [Chloroflexi bacterium]|nr:MAG: 2-phosphosulfolactate phosphatase [Chloroflexota bacterium]